jgi:hypothetical protein
MLNCPVARRLQIQASQANDIRNPWGAIAEHSINYGCAKKQIGYHVCWTRSHHVPRILCFLERRPIFILTSCSQVWGDPPAAYNLRGAQPLQGVSFARHHHRSNLHKSEVTSTRRNLHKSRPSPPSPILHIRQVLTLVAQAKQDGSTEYPKNMLSGNVGATLRDISVSRGKIVKGPRVTM